MHNFRLFAFLSPNKYSFSTDKKNGVSINDATGIWDKWLRKYDNIFMVFCGHTVNDDILINQMVGDHGNVVSAFMINGQGVLENNGLESLISIFGFDEENQLLYINYVSCISEKLFNTQSQFVIDFSGYTPVTSNLYSSNVSKIRNEKTRLESLRKVVEEAKLFNEVNVNYLESETNSYSPIFGYVLFGFSLILLGFNFVKHVYKGGNYEKN